LISSTLLDTLLTPLLFWLLGRKPTQRLLSEAAEATDRDTQTKPQEAF
jgi:HME family heavy-metal exporter